MLDVTPASSHELGVPLPRPPLLLEISFPGNPDLGQVAPVAESISMYFSSVGSCVAAAVLLREAMSTAYGIGGGNWSAYIYGAGNVVRIAWNGSLWAEMLNGKPVDWVSGTDLTDAGAATFLGVGS